ncbi:MAG: right-handed parallel beta-helix repeat-containing protein, partial [Planctomycetia bacterium]
MITASLGVSNSVETTKIFDDIGVTSKTSIPGGYGVVIGSPSILIEDKSVADSLFIETTGTDIEFGGVVTIKDAYVEIDTGTGAGDIDFLGNIIGSGLTYRGLQLKAGTGAISFGGTIGGSGADEFLKGVRIYSAASVTATGKFYLDGTDSSSGYASLDGLVIGTIGGSVNNVNLPNGGTISNFNDGAAYGIFIQGSSTNSTFKQFTLSNNTYGFVIGNGDVEVDMSGTVIDDNRIQNNSTGLALYEAAGGLDGEDALVIGGTVGNVIINNGEDGIYADSSTGVEISKNSVSFNGSDGPDAGSGIKLVNGGEYLIAENSIGEDTGFGNSFDGITIDGEDGFYSYAGTVIRDNSIKDNQRHGVRVQGVTLDTGEDSILIFSNTISKNARDAVSISASTGIRIIDNAIVENAGKSAPGGISILDGSAGTLVYSNTIVGNGYDGVYLEDSSTLLNPTKIGAVLQVSGSDGVAKTVTLAGDQRAAILPSQNLYLVYQTDGTDVKTVTALSCEVESVAYSAITDQTTITLTTTFSTVPLPPVALSLGNYIADNGEDIVVGGGISVYATGLVPDGTVAGLEIVGNVIVGNAAEGIRLEGAASDGEDLTGILIAGNAVGYNPGTLAADGNGKDGIYLRNGSYAAILQNYVAHNGDPNPSNEDENGIAIVTSHHVDIGEDGLGNYIARNANDGVDIKSSRFINIVDNEIALNGDDGIDIRSVVGLDTPRSQDILIESNWIYDNGGSGIEIADADRVEAVDNLIAGNGADGVNSLGSSDVTVAFNIIRDQGGDGVEFRGSTGVIEGNEIYANGEDGVYAYGGDAFNGIVDVLGNIIRENGDDGVEFRGGYFGYDLFDVDENGRLFSVVGGNTIERNVDDGVSLVNVGGVQVGGRFPSDINFINLNGASGIRASGRPPIETPWVANGVWVLGNEIDSNEEYGVCLDGAEDITVGGGLWNGGLEYSQYAGPDAANTIRRNGIAGVFAQGYSENAVVINNDISENPIGVMITSAYGPSGSWFSGIHGLQVGGPSYPEFPAEDSEIGTLGNRIVDNGEGIRATGDCYGTMVMGNTIENNLTGATLASVRGLIFGYGEDTPPRIPLPVGEFGNIVQNNNEGLRGSGDLTDTVVAGNEFLGNTKVGIALQSAKNLTVGGFGEDSPNL